MVDGWRVADFRTFHHPPPVGGWGVVVEGSAGVTGGGWWTVTKQSEPTFTHDNQGRT